MKIVAIYSQKGGVSKTTSSVNIATGMAHLGLRVLLVDLDPQGASTWYLRVKRGESKPGKIWAKTKTSKRIKASDIENLDLLPSDLGLASSETAINEMKKGSEAFNKLLKPVADEYDVCVIDAPPTFGVTAEAIINAADIVACPVVPTWLAERMLEELSEKLPKKTLRPFACMVQKSDSHKKHLKALRNRYKRLAETAIPMSENVEAMGEHRQPVQLFAPKSKGAKAYDDLALEFVDLLGVG